MKRLTQIVITRKDAKTFQVTTFDNKQCLGGRVLDSDAALKLVKREMRRLAKMRSIE